jgi:TRAP-type mannitol/chloroaromatic compound transport system substrate-binding protein
MLRNIEFDSEGALKLDLKGKNGFVNNRSVYNALRTGEIDAMLMTPSYWANADPVFAIMGDLVAAWDNPQQYSRWLNSANGIRYLDEAYARVGLKLLGYSIATPESLIARKPIPNVNALHGLIIRTPPGMISDFFKLLGARVKNISGSKVLSSLEQKRIDVADFSDLSVNNQMGAYRIAKHSNYPGFHSMPLYDFVVRLQSWNKLSNKQKEIVLNAVQQWQLKAYTVSQDELLKAKQEVLSQGVTLHTWSTEELKKARQKASIVWEKYATKSDEAKALIGELKLWLINEGNLDE